MDNRVFIVVGIIVLTGLLGGFGAYLLEVGPGSPGEGQRKRLTRSLFLGIIAALTVPLFLSLTKSGLMGNIFTPDTKPPRPPAFEDYLVFAGLCVIAAVSARRFLDSVSRQILQRVDTIDEKAERANRRVTVTEQKAEHAVNTAETAADLVDERDSAPMPASSRASDFQPSLPPDTVVPSLNEAQRHALESMKHVNFRTATGVARDIAIPRSQIGEVLDQLYEKGLVSRETSPATGGRRWAISPLGLQALASSGD